MDLSGRESTCSSVASAVATEKAPVGGISKAELFWRHASGANHAWLVNGLSVTAEGALPGADANWSVATARDFDGDGKADVLWRHTSGANYLWLMNGLSVPSHGSVQGADPNWSIAPD
jgi:hypothetical protein